MYVTDNYVVSDFNIGFVCPRTVVRNTPKSVGPINVTDKTQREAKQSRRTDNKEGAVSYKKTSQRNSE